MSGGAHLIRLIVHRLGQIFNARCHQNKANFNADGRKIAATRGVRGGALTSSVIFSYPSVPAGGAGQGQGWENFVELYRGVH